MTQDIVYANSTIHRLASTISKLITNPDPSPIQNDDHAALEISKMIKKYSSGLPDFGFDGKSTCIGDFVVLLTGSTGHLGSHLLQSLLQSNRIIRVYTLNRPSNNMSALERQRVAFEEQGFDIESLSSKKLVALEGDASQNTLGLSKHIYKEVRDSFILSYLQTLLKSPPDVQLSEYHNS